MAPVVRDLGHGEGGKPGGRAGAPNHRQPDRERESTADGGRERQRRDIADVRGDEEVGETRHGDRLRGSRHGEHARGPRADGDEADLPERQNARVADEDVEPDDDRDLDQRVEEVRLEVARDLQREQGGRQNEQGRDEHLREPANKVHTRSTAPPPWVKSPSGRRSSTTITAAKMKLDTNWLLSAGSTPPRIPVPRPI